MDKDRIIRKTLALPESMWKEIAEYRARERIGSEMEAIRRLLIQALKANS